MMLLSAPFQEWWPLAFILLAGAVPTQMWRWAGAYLSRSLDEDSEFLRWVKAVASALIAGLIAKLVIFPAGVLAEIPLWLRLMAILVGYGVYFLTRPRIFVGILVAEFILIAGALALI